MVNHDSRIGRSCIRDHNVLHACDYDDLHHNSRILNLELVGPTIHVKLDHKFFSFFRLMSIYEYETKEDLALYTYDYDHRLWVDIPVDILKLDIGYHTYTIEFVNLVTGDTCFQYFGYIIQSDNPDKPYIYMNRDE